MANETREQWTGKLGIIMAVAGSAIGLGNFLRFPAQAVRNGGGAFMIPYLIALVLLGIPLMWIEWTVGRYGGAFGHRTAPGVFHTLWRRPVIKYFGLIGIFGPIVVFIYYTYVESWTLAYAFFSLFGEYSGASDAKSMAAFLDSYQGGNSGHFSGLAVAYVFFLITFLANCWIVLRGISKGIEWLCKWALPILFVIGAVLAVRVLTLGSPTPEHPDWNVRNGLGYMWNPDFGALKSPDVWLAAAGQIFFTLSVGFGVLLTYASYLSRRDDVALSGLSAAGANELAEVILGGTIVIPAAFVFFGPADMAGIARSGSFNLGFVTMPLVCGKLPLGALFGFLWFILLFLAGITSSVSLAQPAVAFLKDEMGISRRKASMAFIVITFLLCQPPIFFLGHGVVDDLDFWGGTFCLVVFAAFETILFGWVFGIDRAWTEMHYGADIRIPRIYRYVIRYVTPVFLLAILAAWFFQRGPVGLRAGDVRDWPSLCSKLRTESAAPAPSIGRRTWELLPATARAAIEEITGGEAATWPRKSAIAAGLKAVQSDARFYRAEDFAGVTLSARARRLAEADPQQLSPDDTQWLNRTLLQAAYPNEIGGRRAKIIEMVLMVDISEPDRPYILGTRLMLVALFVGLVIALAFAWRRRRDIWDRTELPEITP